MDEAEQQPNRAKGIYPLFSQAFACKGLSEIVPACKLGVTAFGLIAQLGRAPRLQRGGHGFESR